MKGLIPQDVIERKIYLIRGQRVMLDRDLARLYEVETRALNQAVRRNLDRFPEDFMFSLTREEIMRISQIVISSSDGMGTLKFAKSVMAFTEYGVSMLSSVLNSPRAVQVNIQIIRTFGKLREIVLANKNLAKRLDELEKKYDSQFRVVFDAMRELIAPNEPKKKRIGFQAKEGSVRYRRSAPTVSSPRYGRSHHLSPLPAGGQTRNQYPNRGEGTREPSPPQGGEGWGEGERNLDRKS